MAAELGALNPVTAEDTAPAVVVAGYTLASVSVLITLIRFSLAAVRNIKFGFDDGFYLFAQLWAIASTITWHMAASAGLGKRMSAIDPNHVVMFFKLSYAAQFTEIASMLCAKAAFALLADRVRGN